MLNWEWVRCFLALSDNKSISKAALVLGVSQPTMSRNLAALEQQLQVSLFKRSNQGVELSPHGLELIALAKKMGSAAEQLERCVQGAQSDLSGTIRLSANEIVAFYLMPNLITEFRKLYPQIQIELVVSNQVTSLSKRDADIALRMFAPTQSDLVAKRLPDLDLGFYASTKYLQTHGAPTNPEQLLQHSLIGFDIGTEFIDAAAKFGWKVSKDDFGVRCDNLLVSIQLLLAGAGILVTHKGLAALYPQIQGIALLEDKLALQFWLVCHHDVHSNPLIRLLMDFLSQRLAKNPYQYCLDPKLV